LGTRINDGHEQTPHVGSIEGGAPLVVPDIVTADLTVTRERLLGWTPIVVDGDIADRERIKLGHITPAELALQLAFGIYNHNALKTRATKYRTLFEDQHLIARKNILGMGSHETGYAMAVALWADRNIIVDYGNSYGSYSIMFDGYSRRMTFASIEDVSRELYENLDGRYIPAVNNGCESVNDMDRYEDELRARELEELGDIEGAEVIRSLHRQ
jgi:hypothetical protein